MGALGVLVFWATAQIVVLAWLALVGRDRGMARLALAALFGGAGAFNIALARLRPDAFLGFEHFAWFETYQTFISGWFAEHTRPFVYLVAAGQLAIAALLTGRGRVARLGLKGALVFLLAIVPLGIGAAFPLPLLLALGAWRLTEFVDESGIVLARRFARTIYPRAFAAWLGLFALAFVNGALRELVIRRFLADPGARHLSALTAAGLFGGWVWWLWPRLRIPSVADAWRVGTAWAIATVVAETWVVGRWLGARPWAEIFEAYDPAKGSSWPLVVLWVLVLPPLCAIWHRTAGSNASLPAARI